MPIHDQGYRRYGGTRAGGRAWLVMFNAGFFGMFRNRKWLVLMIASWIQFIVRAVQFYIAANFSQAASIVAPSAETFRDFFDKQDIFVFLVTVTLGAVSIADDRRANALPFAWLRIKWPSGLSTNRETHPVRMPYRASAYATLYSPPPA